MGYGQMIFRMNVYLFISRTARIRNICMEINEGCKEKHNCQECRLRNNKELRDAFVKNGVTLGRKLGMIDNFQYGDKNRLLPSDHFANCIQKGICTK